MNQIDQLREALEAMLSYTAELNPNQGFDETDHPAVKQACAALSHPEHASQSGEQAGELGDEERTLSAFLSAMHEKKLDGAKMRQAMLKVLGFSADHEHIPQGVLTAIRAAGLTLTKTQRGYELRNLGRIEAQSTPAPEAQSAEWVPDMAHLANEWADAATNGPTYLDNVRDGIYTFDQAKAMMKRDFAHCREVGARVMAALQSTPAPAAVPLTEEQAIEAWDEHIVPVFGKLGINPIVFARAIIAKFCEVNGITAPEVKK